LKDFEVIVVDDRSTDGTAEIVRSFSCRLLTSAERRGAAAARNLGVKHAAGSLIYFLDADILIEPDTLDRIVEAFDRHPEVSAIFGSFGKNTVPQNFVSVYKNLLHHYTHQNSNQKAATFCGGFSGIRRDVFEDLGGFDPAYPFMEDVELGCRLYRKDYRIWLNPTLQATHCKHYTLAGLVKSDFFGRAIPWTRIILEQRVFRNDLNTRIHNVLSVPLAFLLPAGLLYPAFRHWLALPLAVAFVALNRGFLGLVRRERGLWFASRAALLCWFSYLYSGVGALLGSAIFLRDRKSVV
jgi:GT2 family glycosyltransferase